MSNRTHGLRDAQSSALASRRRFLGVGLAAMGVGLLAACVQVPAAAPSAPPPTAAPQPTQAPAPTTAAAAAKPTAAAPPATTAALATPIPQLVLVASETPNALDTQADTSAVIIAFSANWVSSLLRYKGLAADAQVLPSPADVEGELADSWSMAPDGMTIKLRPARSVAGNTLSADDVKWSFDRGYALKSIYHTFLLGTGGIDPTNPTTVVDQST